MKKDRTEEFMRRYYTSKNCEGLSTIFTPKEVRDKMTIHAKKEMKILVMFNFEFCYDLVNMDCKDVMFISDDKLRNQIVEKTWGFKTELVNPKAINNTLKDMKFDLIISNPPYTKNLDLKILESVLDLSDNVCFVHPSAWLLKNTENKHVPDYRNIIDLNNRIISVDLINGNELFGISLFMPCAVTFFSKYRKNDIIVNDTSKMLTVDDKLYKVSNIYDIDRYGYNPQFKFIKQKIFSKTTIQNLNDKSIHPNHISLNTDTVFIKNGKTYSKEFIVGIPNIRGNVASDDFFTMILKNKHSHLGINTQKYYTIFFFDNETEQMNFINFLTTKFARFCLSLTKTNQHMQYVSIPWLDFTRSWTDQECATELGITNEELLWMIQQIPNYYPEDEETYKQLENKLKADNV